MIEKLKLDPDVEEMQINIWQKLNEVIDATNSITTLAVLHHEGLAEVEKASKKAATTGSRADLREYLKLRKKYAITTTNVTNVVMRLIRLIFSILTVALGVAALTLRTLT